MRIDEGKKGSESRYVVREVNHREKRGRKERNNRESGRGKVNHQIYAKRRSYSEAGGIENRKGIYGRLHFAKDRQDNGRKTNKFEGRETI